MATSNLEVSVLCQKTTDVTLSEISDAPWILSHTPDVATKAPVLEGCLYSDSAGDLYHTRGSRVVAFSSREIALVGGSNEDSRFAPQSITLINGTQTPDMDNPVIWIDEVFAGTSTQQFQLAVNETEYRDVTAITLQSYNEGIYLANVTWTLSAVPNAGNVSVQLYDDTAGAALGTQSTGGPSNTNGSNMFALFHKPSGTTANLKLRVIGTATNTPNLFKIAVLLVRIGPLDPNPIATGHSTPVTRPAAS